MWLTVYVVVRTHKWLFHASSWNEIGVPEDDDFRQDSSHNTYNVERSYYADDERKMDYNLQEKWQL